MVGQAGQAGQAGGVALRERWWGLGLLLGALAGGCSHGLTVEVPVVEPPALPLPLQAPVWVASQGLEGDVAIENLVADWLAGHLAARVAGVRRVRVRDLEPARRSGRIPAGTLVVIVRSEEQAATAARYVQRPDTYCGPVVCSTQVQTMRFDVPLLRVNVEVSGYDGPRAEPISRRTLRAQQSGRDHLSMRQDAALALAQQALRLFDAQASRLAVTLLELDDEAADQALQMAAGGELQAGLTALRGWLAAPGFANLPIQTQAHAHFNHAQVLRLVAALPFREQAATADDLERAIAALERGQIAMETARQLEPQSPRIRRANAALRAQLQRTRTALRHLMFRQSPQRRPRQAGSPTNPATTIEVPPAYR